MRATGIWPIERRTKMLFALIGFYREGAEEHLLEISRDVNEYLGQVLVPPRLAAVLKGQRGERIGNLVVVAAADFAQAEARLKDSPALQAGLYERSAIAEFNIEIGDIPEA
jgi:hypothetical protein